MARVNADLIGKFVNIASRAAGFIAKRFDGAACRHRRRQPARWSQKLPSPPASRRLRAARLPARVVREIMALADMVNAYVDANKPWELAKLEGQKSACTTSAPPASRPSAVLTMYLKPILPQLAARCRRVPDQLPPRKLCR